MFTPTEAELLERGFENRANVYDNVFFKMTSFWYYYIELQKEKSFFCINWWYKTREHLHFYPTSFEDIDAIIRIFTPPK